jgi:hypothetical protein
VWPSLVAVNEPGILSVRFSISISDINSLDYSPSLEANTPSATKIFASFYIALMFIVVTGYLYLE